MGLYPLTHKRWVKVKKKMFSLVIAEHINALEGPVKAHLVCTPNALEVPCIFGVTIVAQCGGALLGRREKRFPFLDHISTNRPPLPHPISQSFPDQKLAMPLRVRMRRTSSSSSSSSSSVLISSQFCATLVSRKGERLFAACRVQESKEGRMERGKKSPPDCVYAHMRREGGSFHFCPPFSPYTLTTGKKGCMHSWHGGGQRKTLSLAPTNRPSLLARPFSILFIPLAHPSGPLREGVGFFCLFEVVFCGFRCFCPFLNIEDTFFS